ncbi:retrovirus-related Pol polyprotein from transposon TNT 1-94 [Trifolium pratense]|uniref:Retrovirus-related Pol polyprotein from transposon TNT 1-94 n=1 Tax=Trifolium pratense TaxID=57577 RepID=A0A2K3NNX3_TRIPR|nr:retrovirus-related Pol polyprotein from transposon TNT 1-94 [Trifolium pratense]
MATDPNNSSSIIETTPPPPTPTSTQTHPALTVPNITNFIKITLSMEKGTYNTWSELFKIHARVFQVIDHIIPSTEPSTIPSLKTIDPSLWRRLDAVWIYGTISEDLLNIIIEQDSTAETAWNRLFEIFYDNKNSRALYLEQEFSRTRMEQFSDASSYCQHLKSLFDQMANVGTSISKERLVLQLISGLTDAYAAVGSEIRHAAILPDFYKARSMIILEETALQKKVSNSVDNTALMASNNETSTDHTSSRPNRGGSNNNHGGRSNGRGHRGRGRGQNHGRGGGRFPQHSPPWQPWATPPCPYPTTDNSNKQPGILGPKPLHQAHVASTLPSYSPTDIQTAMHTLSLSPPDDQWYMDTGATSHMTANEGQLLMRCNSSGDLYPVATRPPSTTQSPSTYAAYYPLNYGTTV